MHKCFKNKKDFITQYETAAQLTLGKSVAECEPHERYVALVQLVGSRAREASVETENQAKKAGKKKVYYFSLEFLIGPLLDNYLINFGVRDIVEEGCADLGIDLDEVLREEGDPGLGNGGLGRLAACYLDSMAHEGIAGYGNGMRYRYGLFRQEIEGGRQVEKTDNWLAKGYPWEVRKATSAVEVTFGGEVVRHEDEKGKYWFTLEGGEHVLAVPYDVPIVGYGGETVNKLRLWSAEPASEDFDLDAFNAGDYAAASKFRSDVEAISTVLYPNDSGEHGKILRMKQEYLFVSAGLQTILRSYEKEHGPKWKDLGKHVAIHTNDTHPSLAGPELMRLLVDEKGLTWDDAWAATTSAIAFTNHTVMPEAMEKWPIEQLRAICPRTYMYIEEIDRRFHEKFPQDDEGWSERLKNTAILWDGQVRMANLSIICGHSVNGVSALHTEILKNEVLKDFYAIQPEKFNNKTNGISHRRFLAEANKPLAKVITNCIGDGWLDDASELSKLTKFEKDASVLDDVMAARRADKERLAAYLSEASGVTLDPNSVFDVHVKRFHAYKRQLLGCFKVIDIYNRLLADPSYDPQPTSFIFAGKAAGAYTYAKEIIRLVNSIADVVNNDERVNDKIRVAFVPNFAVSNAQLIYPATDISEQVSTAGTEGSGTSNMKVTINGSVILGTYDGANIEIADLVGEDNIKIFGLRVEDIERLRQEGYWCWNEYNADRERLGRVVDQLTDGSFARLSGNFERIHDELMGNNDADLVLKDFHSYVTAWDELTDEYRADSRAWARKCLHNTASMGHFSSDRAIREYATDIWGIKL